MSDENIWDRFLKGIEGIREDEPSLPPIELTAFIVAWERRLRNWKIRTLADFAKISVSTIERVERGEPVSRESLDSIAVAFGYGPGHFTEPRLPLRKGEIGNAVSDQFGHLEIVPVRPLKSQIDVRNLARCHGVLVQAPGVPDMFADQIKGLVEWMDLAGFMLSQYINGGHASEGCRRELYSDILSAAADLQRQGLTILSGVMNAPQPDFKGWKVAVISITPKATDPGATKRKNIFVDRRIVTGTSGPWWLDEEGYAGEA